MDTHWALYGIGAVALATLLSWAPRRAAAFAREAPLADRPRTHRATSRAPRSVLLVRRARVLRERRRAGRRRGRIAARRSSGSPRDYRDASPGAVALAERLEHGLSDVAFTNAYRVPFQYRELRAPTT